MPYRPGGLDPADIDAAFTALGRAASAADLEQAIEALPTLRSPVFHGMLRHRTLDPTPLLLRRPRRLS